MEDRETHGQPVRLRRDHGGQHTQAKATWPGFGMAIGTVFGRIAGTRRPPSKCPKLTPNGLTRHGGRLAATWRSATPARYCEGYCAVFPAMQMRREFTSGDLNYLANLCHSCKWLLLRLANTPRPMSSASTFPRRFWPKSAPRATPNMPGPPPWPRLYRTQRPHHGRSPWAGGIMRRLPAHHGCSGGTTRLFSAPARLVPGHGFYDVVPYGAMVWTASATFLFSLLAMAIGFARFWRATGGTAQELRGKPLLQALRDAATLRYLGGGGSDRLGGGGGGCNDRDESFSSSRRHSLHHAMAYGFASTATRPTLARHPTTPSSAPLHLRTCLASVILACHSAEALRDQEPQPASSSRRCRLSCSFMLLTARHHRPLPAYPLRPCVTHATPPSSCLIPYLHAVLEVRPHGLPLRRPPPHAIERPDPAPIKPVIAVPHPLLLYL